ncbi:hypothetical protein WJX84_003536 [Apatococcus fuscideae]|uniref:Uncharacterized protein n=1 Tax=Apatococcus fuscideae TaxID=2026836 RepID=A0AAW1SZ68_9CHLO
MVLLYLLRDGPAVTRGSSMDSTGALTLSVPVIVLQVQKLKVDLESAMLEIDQILRANELSISLVAAVPAILIAGATLTLLWRLCSPKMPDPKRQAVPCRMAMVELERAISKSVDHHQDSGEVLYRLAVVLDKTSALLSQHKNSFVQAEWQNLRQDLVDIASPIPMKAKLQLSERVMRVYTIFQS